MINAKQSKGRIGAAKYRAVQRWLQKGNHCREKEELYFNCTVAK